MPHIITASVPVLYLQAREHILFTESALCSLSGKISWAWLACFGWIWALNPFQHPGRYKGSIPNQHNLHMGMERIWIFPPTVHLLLGRFARFKHLPCLNLQCTVHRALGRFAFFFLLFLVQKWGFKSCQDRRGLALFIIIKQSRITTTNYYDWWWNISKL